MKKIILSFIFTLVSILSFVSCSKDDVELQDDPNCIITFAEHFFNKNSSTYRISNINYDFYGGYASSLKIEYAYIDVRDFEKYFKIENVKCIEDGKGLGFWYRYECKSNIDNNCIIEYCCPNSRESNRSDVMSIEFKCKYHKHYNKKLH